MEKVHTGRPSGMTAIYSLFQGTRGSNSLRQKGEIFIKKTTILCLQRKGFTFYNNLFIIILQAHLFTFLSLSKYLSDDSIIPDLDLLRDPALQHMKTDVTAIKFNYDLPEYFRCQNVL